MYQSGSPPFPAVITINQLAVFLRVPLLQPGENALAFAPGYNLRTLIPGSIDPTCHTYCPCKIYVIVLRILSNFNLSIGRNYKRYYV